MNNRRGVMEAGNKVMFDTLQDVRRLVRDFESAVLPPAGWDHRAQLAVAAWYMSGLAEEEAAERFITGLRRYNYQHGIGSAGTDGYHETETLFWLSFVRSFLDQVLPGRSRLEGINYLLTRFAGRSDLIFDFYQRETLEGFEARRSWVEPDRRPLETIDSVCRGCEQD